MNSKMLLYILCTRHAQLAYICSVYKKLSNYFKFSNSCHFSRLYPLSIPSAPFTEIYTEIHPFMLFLRNFPLKSVIFIEPPIV